jgi:hypothetical protein
LRAMRDPLAGESPSLTCWVPQKQYRDEELP